MYTHKPTHIKICLGSPQETVDFDRVSVHATASVPLTLLNTTPLPLDFEWTSHLLPETMLPLSRSRAVAPPQLSSNTLPLALDLGNIYIHAHTHTHVYMYTYIHMHTYIYIYIYTYTYMRKYIHTHTHTHTHIYIYIYI